MGALARAYGDGLVNLTVGNLRKNDRVTVWLEILAGVELRDDGLRFGFRSHWRPRISRRRARLPGMAREKWSCPRTNSAT